MPRKVSKSLSKNSAVMTIRIVVRCSCFYIFFRFEIKRIDRRLLAGQRYSLRSQLHRIFTSAHADGCAEQCFEGVQFGSIIISSRSLDQRIATPLVGNDRDRSLNEVMAYLPPGSPCCKSTCPSYAASRAFFFKVLHRLLLARISHQTENLITDTRKQEKPIAAAWKGEHTAVCGQGIMLLWSHRSPEFS